MIENVKKISGISFYPQRIRGSGSSIITRIQFIPSNIFKYLQRIQFKSSNISKGSRLYLQISSKIFKGWECHSHRMGKFYPRRFWLVLAMRLRIIHINAYMAIYAHICTYMRIYANICAYICIEHSKNKTVSLQWERMVKERECEEKKLTFAASIPTLSTSTCNSQWRWKISNFFNN